MNSKDAASFSKKGMSAKLWIFLPHILAKLIVSSVNLLILLDLLVKKRVPGPPLEFLTRLCGDVVLRNRNWTTVPKLDWSDTVSEIIVLTKCHHD